MGQVRGRLKPSGRSTNPAATRGSGRARRRGPLALVAVLFPVLAVVLTAIPAASAGVTQPVGRRAAAATRYAIGVPVCKPAKPGHDTCYVMRRVEVTKGTPGARPFVPGAGVSASGMRSGPDQTIGPSGGLTPSDLATAYGYSPTATGSTQTVAVVDAYNDPNISTDLTTFDTEYSLSCNQCLTVVGQTGSKTSLPANDTTGWSVEESLDVEAVHAVCQECKILLVEANSSESSDLAAGVDEAASLGATEISNSYGAPENSANEAAYSHPGIVITASAGDDGYYDYDLLGADYGEVNAPNSPASFPSVVAVGGTSLYLGQTAARQSETVWNDNGPQDYYQSVIGQRLGASGGGCSTMFPAEDWQTGLSVWSSTGCGAKRLVSDVSADADPLTGLGINDTYNWCSGQTPCNFTSGWQTVGGTSLSSPIIASIYALAGGSHGVADPGLSLYGHVGSTSWYDVTSGGNGYCDGEGAAACGDRNLSTEGALDCDYSPDGSTLSSGDRACDAQAGYDGPSGLGTPNGLAGFAPSGPKPAVSGPTSVTAGVSNEWKATATDPFPGGAVVSYDWRWGDGTTTTTTTDSATHVYKKSGVTEDLDLKVTDNYSQWGTKLYPVKVT
jgi:hypothetical protein